MMRAFAKGYDPVLELASASMYEQDGQLKAGRVLRKEQEYISKIINGEGKRRCWHRCDVCVLR